MTPAEAAATALAPLVREHGFQVDQHAFEIYLRPASGSNAFLLLWCDNEAEGTRLAALLRGEQEAMPEGWQLVPVEPTAEILAVFTDKESLYGVRRSMDKSGYEITRPTNEDWREVVDEFHVLGWHATQQAAQTECDKLNAQWRYAAMLAAAPKVSP